MKVLGIDASRAVKKEKTGVEWYSYFLLRAMEKCIPKGWKVILYTPTKYESDTIENWEWKVLKWPGKGWTQGRLSMEMMKKPPDVLFIPSHAIPLVHPDKTINTVHDVVFLKYPELYAQEDLQAQKRGLDFALKFAKKIIAPSKATRNDVLEAGAKQGQVAVIPHGVEYTISEIERRIVKAQYILFIGRIEKKKNVMNLIHAFRQLNSNVKLVLAGSKGYGAEDIDLAIKTFKLKEKVIQLGWTNRSAMAELMQNAELLILPSFGEGFGLPVLEAMSAGTPVVCSDIPVLHEVGSNAVQYVDPHNPKDIARGIEAVLTNDMLQSEMVKKGKERAQEYTWEKSAKSTWEIITGL